MYTRRIGFALLIVLLFAGGTACNKSAPADSGGGTSKTATSPAPAPKPETVVRLHWLGMKRIASDTNAAYLVTNVWSMAQTAKLKAQTLDKLALAITGSLPGTNHQSPITNYQPFVSASHAARKLRPLLDDLIEEELYVEIQQVAKEPSQAAMAIRLSEERAALWQTNLAAALESLAGAQTSPTANGWQFESAKRITNFLPPVAAHHIEISRSGNWTLLNLTFGDSPRSALNPQPLSPQEQPTNYWLEADLDLASLTGALGFHRPTEVGLPKASITVSGDGANVRTRGLLDFPQPLEMELQPWSIPTNLIHDPLIGFTAIRGVRPFLSSWTRWDDLALGPPFDQIFLWAQDGAPLFTFLATPMSDSTNRVNQFTKCLLERVNPLLQKQYGGQFEVATNGNGASWAGMPMVSPFMEAMADGGTEFAMGGLLRYTGRRPMPPQLTTLILTSTNLVYYDWEITEPRVGFWLYNCQLARLLLGGQQLESKSISIEWLLAVAPKLGNCITEVTRTGPAQLSLIRKSSAGLKALELQLLGDWLESPSFPRGLFSTSPIKSPKQKRSRSSVRATPTNSPTGPR